MTKQSTMNRMDHKTVGLLVRELDKHATNKDGICHFTPGENDATIAARVGCSLQSAQHFRLKMDYGRLAAETVGGSKKELLARVATLEARIVHLEAWASARDPGQGNAFRKEDC